MVTPTTTRLADAKQAIRHAQEGMDLAVDMLGRERPAGAYLCCANAVDALREALALLSQEINTVPAMSPLDERTADGDR